MKKLLLLLLFLLVICLILVSCGKKKQRELEAKEALAKTERAEAFSHLKSIPVVAYIIDFVFENKEKSIGTTIPVIQILAGETFIYVYKGKEHSFILNNSLWGIKQDDKIYLKEGYVKATGVKYKLVPLVIDKPQKFWTKEELQPWIKKYPLTAVEYDGVHYPTFYDLECFNRTATAGVKNIYIKEGPTVQARCGNIYLFFNLKYNEWGRRSEYKK